MWVVHLALGLAALYAAIITAMYFAQTWLLFPSALVGAGQVELPAPTQRLEVKTPDGETLVGVRIPSEDTAAEGAATLLGFGGNAMSADRMALTLHWLFPHRDVVVFNYRGYAPSTGRPSALALFSDSLMIFDRLLQARASHDIIAVGFSVGSAIAAYVARRRPVAGLILVTPFDSLEALAQDLYWWAPVRLFLRHHMPTIEFVHGSLAPTALVVAERDKIVPARRSAPLRRAVSNLVFERAIDAGHNDIYDHASFVAAMREALATIEAASVGLRGRPDQVQAFSAKSGRLQSKP
jgi:pimeloyl-ACP methyl ester carboxylesterase